MTEEEYLRDYGLIYTDISVLIDAFYSNLEFNKIASDSIESDDKEIIGVINKNARFWMVQMYATQATCFVVLYRIFSTQKDEHSIYRLFEAVAQNIHLFSKGSLRMRKLRRENGQEPEWLDNYISEAWELTSDELRKIRKSLAPYKRQFDNVYSKIRHSFAHHIYKDPQSLSDVFSKARYDDIENLLHFLHNLMENLDQIFHNGRQPGSALDPASDEVWQSRIERPKQEVRNVLAALTAGYSAGD